MSKNLFTERYIKKMTDIMTKVNPKWDKEDIEETISKMIKKQGHDPRVKLDNSYTHETKNSTVLSVLNWVEERKPIIAGNAAFFKNQHEAINPTAKMLETFDINRSSLKDQMFSIPDSQSPEYKYLDRSQLNEKINANSWYGAQSAPSSPFYNVWIGPSITHSAQEVISSAENYFEGFIADNYNFLNLNECIEWIECMLKSFKKDDEYIDDWVKIPMFDNVFDRFSEKILLKEKKDEEILRKYLSYLTDDELTYLYYKNNLIKFISDHDTIKDLIFSIFENTENLEYADKSDSDWFSKIPKEYRDKFVGKSPSDWNSFVNNTFFMNPNKVPSQIKQDVELLNDFMMKYVHASYLSADRIYRLRNFKRKTVTIIDTDSNILSLDPYVNFIMKDIIKGKTFGRSKKNNVFITINTLAFVLSSGIDKIMKLFGKHSNVPEDYRWIYRMKNEFLFLRLVIGKTKKRYISKNVLREGTYLNPPKYDIKGFDFKKSTTSDETEEFFMGLIKKYIINSESVDIKELIIKIKEFKEEITKSIRNGETKFLPLANAKNLGAYKNPNSMQSVIAINTWNMLFPDNKVQIPSKVSILKLNMFDEEDIKDLKTEKPEIYNTIVEKVFNDKTGMYVTKKVDGKTQLVDLDDKDWFKKIPSKYRTKYKKLGPKAWNEFVSNNDIEDDNYQIKSKGIQVIAIPSNATIPKWLDKYIDYPTIINNIIAPFIPVLDIFQARILNEGKVIKSVDRKSKTFSNIVKF